MLWLMIEEISIFQGTSARILSKVFETLAKNFYLYVVLRNFYFCVSSYWVSSWIPTLWDFDYKKYLVQQTACSCTALTRELHTVIDQIHLSLCSKASYRCLEQYFFKDQTGKPQILLLWLIILLWSHAEMHKSAMLRYTLTLQLPWNAVVATDTP